VHHNLEEDYVWKRLKTAPNIWAVIDTGANALTLSLADAARVFGETPTFFADALSESNGENVYTAGGVTLKRISMKTAGGPTVGLTTTVAVCYANTCVGKNYMLQNGLGVPSKITAVISPAPFSCAGRAVLDLFNFDYMGARKDCIMLTPFFATFNLKR
jgi:hypothetical protein